MPERRKEKRKEKKGMKVKHKETPTTTWEEDDTSSSSSSASSETHGVSNLRRYVARPLDQSGKSKRGHLIFDASFESGNIGRVDRIDELEYDLFIRPDIGNPRFRYWFYFSVHNAYKMQKTIFNVVNLSRVTELFHQGFRPVVSSTSRPKWKRLPEDWVAFHRCPHHRFRYILTLFFTFDVEEDIYRFALCFPYTNTKLETFLTSCEKDTTLSNARKNNSSSQLGPISFKREKIGQSLGKRVVELLTIENEDNIEEGTEKGNAESSLKRIVIVTARIHPSETPASFICQGLIEFLLSQTKESQSLLKHVVFKIVPMLNPDGVYVGNTRTNIIGADLNKMWSNPSPVMHPTLVNTKAILNEIVGSRGKDVDIYIDLHAHTNLFGATVHGINYTDVFRMEKHALFPKLLSRHAAHFYLDNCVFTPEVATAERLKRCPASLFPPTTDCYTFEVSYLGFWKKSTTGHQIVAYEEDSYRLLGFNIGLALLDCYETIGLIKNTEKISDRGLSPVNLPLHQSLNIKDRSNRVEDEVQEEPTRSFELLDCQSGISLHEGKHFDIDGS